MEKIEKKRFDLSGYSPEQIQAQIDIIEALGELGLQDIHLTMSTPIKPYNDVINPLLIELRSFLPGSRIIGNDKYFPREDLQPSIKNTANAPPGLQPNNYTLDCYFPGSEEFYLYEINGQQRFYRNQHFLTDPSLKKKDVKLISIPYLSNKVKTKLSGYSSDDLELKSKYKILGKTTLAQKKPQIKGTKRKHITPGELKCCYCEISLDKTNYSREHLIPLDRGGPNANKNIKPCCVTCNNEKDNMILKEYIMFLIVKGADMKVNSPEQKFNDKKLKNANTLARNLKL